MRPGESRKVSFRIKPSMLQVVNSQGVGVINGGKHTVYIAGAAPLERSTALGAAKPVSALLMVK
jgi:hypothetical protein